VGRLILELELLRRENAMLRAELTAVTPSPT
jgi:hypothetical protein